MSQRRIAERKPFVEMVTVITSKGKKFVSQSENLSTHGIFVVVNDPLPVGEHGLVSVVYDGEVHKQEIHCKFEVTHVNTTENGSHGMGLRFLDLSDIETRMLQRNLEGMSDTLVT